MAKPIAVTQGICMAFPDMLLTPIPPGGQAPMPYPNIAQLADAKPVATTVTAGGKEVIVEDSEIPTSTGGEAGTLGTAANGSAQINKACTFTGFSSSVFAEGKAVVRIGDSTQQNDGNAVGQVLGGDPTVLVGG